MSHQLCLPIALSLSRCPAVPARNTPRNPLVVNAQGEVIQTGEERRRILSAAPLSGNQQTGGAAAPRTGDTDRNPLVVDRQGRVVQELAKEQAQALQQRRRMTFTGLPSTAIPHTRAAMVSRPPTSSCTARTHASSTPASSAHGGSNSRHRHASPVAAGSSARNRPPMPSPRRRRPFHPRRTPSPIPLQAQLTVAVVATVGSPRRPDHSLVRFGDRRQRRPALQQEDLWLSDERPPDILDVKLHHKCDICQCLKSHPVL
ncbi:hypothetical protein B0H17DRAFT_1217559 [Mycena rosella]|uniref:Uncharacterized protein n=1 Tax=Mycena rosella TaxID=1033263 RepID=A0AAD7BVF9_MYCRO|nr:hypothetical protein B0H17DRAFT_1217559 [Mycena rosella]